MNYKLTQTGIQRLSDGAFIPKDTGNRDYAEYLAWIDEGNEALPADLPNPNDVIQSQISALESEITSRRLREALTGNADAITWITNQDNKITLLRKQLIRK